MDEPIIPQSAAFHVRLPTFEGPLDLLLHLIKKHELDILDLPIAFVTERYLEYLDVMQVLDLDVASEYLLMAATLAHIKSKMLLPQTPNDALEEQEDAYQEDPRAELIRRLLEYQKYRAAAEQLAQRPQSGRDVFVRGTPAVEAQGPAPLASFDLYKLLDAFQSILKRVQGRVALEVSAETITIHERMTQLSDLLRIKRSCTFEELFAGVRTRYEVVVTFLALLEMTKLRMTRIYQADPKSAIHVQYALLDADSPSLSPEEAAAELAAAAAVDAAQEQSVPAEQSESSGLEAAESSDEAVALDAVALEAMSEPTETETAVELESVRELANVEAEWGTAQGDEDFDASALAQDEADPSTTTARSTPPGELLDAACAPSDPPAGPDELTVALALPHSEAHVPDEFAVAERADDAQDTPTSDAPVSAHVSTHDESEA